MSRLVLVGGGHAHLHVLAEAARVPLPGRTIDLVSSFDVHHYSGMVPGFLQRAYREDEIRFDLAGLCARAGARFHRGTATRIDVRERVVEVDGGRIPFDHCSLDVGAAAMGDDTPGVREHACAVRPMSRALVLRDAIEMLGRAAHGGTATVAVVGGGVAGVEVALAVHRALRDAGAQPVVTVVESQPTILAGESSWLRRVATRILSARGIAIRSHAAVIRVESDRLVLNDATTLPARLTVWLTGAAAPALLRASDLPRDDRGFLRVDATLRAVDGVPVWGAGDCVALDGHPEVAKAGVYAVREAPILAHNLRAAATGREPVRYRPQRSFLALFNTADGKALLRWHGVVLHARAAWWLKDAIDRAFVRRYRDAAA